MKHLFLAAAAAVLALPALAHATADNASIQVNLDTLQVSNTLVHNVSAGSTTLTTQAVGNSLSDVSDTPFANHGTLTRRDDSDARNASLQINAFTAQVAVAKIDHSSFNGLDSKATAVGNTTYVASTNGNFDPGFHQNLTGGLFLQGFVGQGDGSTSIQANWRTLQLATQDVDHVNVYGVTTLTSQAVGNDTEALAGKNGTFADAQLNGESAQLASLSLNHDYSSGSADLSAISAGNVFSLQADSADGASLQGNYRTLQASNLSISNSTFGAGLTGASVSVGNSVSIHTGTAP